MNKLMPIGLTFVLSATFLICIGKQSRSFSPDKDPLSLHYDHTPDKDDGQSAAADRTVLESLFGMD